MAKDLHKDDFEDFFKNTFEEESELSGNEGWDIPSDKVWPSIDKAINPEEDDPRGGFLWFSGFRKWVVLGTILLLSVVVFFVVNANQKTDLISVSSKDEVVEKDMEATEFKNELTETKEKNAAENLDGNEISETVIEHPSESLNTKAKSIQDNLYETSNLNQDKASSLNANEKRGQVDPLQKESDAKENRSTDSKTKTPQNDPNKALTPYDVPVIEEDSNKVKKDIAIQVDEPEKGDLRNNSNKETNNLPSKNNKELFEVFNQIPTKSSLVESQNTGVDTLMKAIAFTDFNDPLDLPEGMKRGFYIGAKFAPMSNYRVIEAKRLAGVLAVQFREETPNITFSTGINLGYKLTENWSLETGLNYSKISIEHDRRRQVQYSVIGEEVNDVGEFEKNYNLDLNTSSGEVDTDVALVRSSGTSIPENDFINLRLRTQYNVSFLNVPLVARYQFGKGKIQIGLKAGLVNRFVTKGEFQIESAEVLRTGLRLILNDRFYEPRTLRNLKSYEADFLIGAGVHYHFNDNLWLSVEPTITRSINPVFENQNFKTFPVFRSLDLGVNYLF